MKYLWDWDSGNSNSSVQSKSSLTDACVLRRCTLHPVGGTFAEVSGASLSLCIFCASYLAGTKLSKRGTKGTEYGCVLMPAMLIPLSPFWLPLHSLPCPETPHFFRFLPVPPTTHFCHCLNWHQQMMFLPLASAQPHSGWICGLVVFKGSVIECDGSGTSA